MCRTTSRISVALRGLSLAATLFVFSAALVTPSSAAETCNGQGTIAYVSGSPFLVLGDTVRVRLTIGSGSIQGGTQITINRTRFELDCNVDFGMGVPCTDDGAVVSYLGNITTDCGVVWSDGGHAVGTLPNEVVFTPSAPIVIAANTPSFCNLEFDVRIDAYSSDSTPATAEEAAGFNSPAKDAVCNTPHNLTTGNTSTGALQLCPVCDDNNQCNGLETCNQQTGECVPGQPFVCDDHNVCTDDTCNPAVPAPGDPCVFTPKPADFCNDNNACTADTCNPQIGCVHTDISASCNDNNACTADRCDPAVGCVHTDISASCNDNNACTDDSCNPATGCVNTPKPADFCDDHNACTADRCDPAVGCVHTDISASCNDNNACTSDRCEPTTGQCVYTPIVTCDDNDPCTTDTCDPGTGQCEFVPISPPPPECVACELAVEKTCEVPQTPAPFVCSNAKPIHSLTMQWEPGSSADPTRWVLTNPNQVVDIEAWNGTPGSTLVATKTDIKPGDIITVTGFSGSVLNVYWEIFAAGTGFGTKLGNSAFHISCSDVDMNTSDDCGKLEGDLKVTSGFTGLINDWRFEGMAGDNAALVCSPAPGTPTSECVVGNVQPVDCTTQGKPTSLSFLYNGNTCANPDNNNPQSGKFLCTGSIDPSLPITVSNAQGYLISPATVSPGETFTVSAGSFQAQSVFTLTNAGGTETESIHTSCSQVLAVGNVFGSLTLVAFNGQQGGNQVTYTYKVTNRGAVTLNDVLLSDTVNGVEVAHEGPFSLAGGETKAFQSTASITENTINVVTVSANGGQCTATDSATVIVTCDLGYPFTSANPLTSLVFNESEVLRTFAPPVASAGDTIKVWYNDEHALTLGVRRVNVKTTSGTTSTTYPITPLGSNPGSSSNPAVGSTALTGDQAGTDLSGRPMFPVLFITDITNDPMSKAGDWQFGGIGIPPHAVFGTWKGAVRSVDKTKTPAVVTVTPDADPAKNNWNLGPGSDTPPGGFASLANEGCAAEVRWNVDDLGLLPGHVYRMQFMVHDGDQNKTGGDVGQACMTVATPAP